MRVPALVVAAASACAVAGFAVSGGVARTLAPGTLRVAYIRSSSLQFQDTNGNPISSMPAGSYQVVVDDPDDQNPSFNMSGPGVSGLSNNNLNSSGMGIDRPAFFGPFNFQAGATYTASDSNIAGSSISLNVTAGGGSSGGTTTGSSGVTTTQSTGTTKTTSGTTTLATLTGTVSAAGKATLTLRGSIVRKLKAGRYKLTVADHSKRAGLVVQKLGYPAMTESAMAKTGTSTHTLTLSSGKWFFASSAQGKKTYFSVT